MDYSNAISNYFMFRRNGIKLAEWVARSNKTLGELVQLGMPEDYAMDVLDLAELLFRPVVHTRYQKRCRKYAANNEHCVETLALIFRASRSIKDPTQRWKFREALCNTAGDTDVVRRTARRIKKAYRPTQSPQDGVRVRRSGAKTTVTFTGDSSALEDVVNTLRSGTNKTGDPLDPILWLCGKRQDHSAEDRAHAVMPMSDLQAIMKGSACSTGVRLADGSVVHGSDFADRELISLGRITLVAEGYGPPGHTTVPADSPGMQKAA